MQNHATIIFPSTEPPKFPDTSAIEVEEKPEEPLEWYLLGLRYITVLVKYKLY